MNVHWNTLYVTTDGAYLHKDHDTVVVRVEHETKAQLPLLHLGSVVCFGRVSVSPELMAAMMEAGSTSRSSVAPGASWHASRGCREATCCCAGSSTERPMTARRASRSRAQW